MELKLKNKIVLVSGGTRGIGLGIVRAFLAEGATVLATGRSDAAVEEASKGMDASARQRCHFNLLDMTDEASVSKLFETIEAEYKGLDILVNNAGVNDAVGLREPPSRFLGSLEKNLLHYFSCVHFALDGLIQKKGAILNIGSKTAVTGQGGTSGYAAANGGINALTREWAVDLAAHGIRVNCLIPAEVITPQYEAWLAQAPDPEEALRRLNQSIPFGNRTTTMEEIAAMAVFLCSPLSAHTTGQLIHVDGGYVHLDRAMTSGATHLKSS